MARIRTIKPEFWTSESIGRISRDARLLFIALWNLADDSGRIRGSLPYLSGAAFPYDEDARALIGGWLAQLEQHGMVRCWKGDDGNSYIDIPNWLKHQKIEKPSPSKLPAFPDSSPTPPRLLPDSSPLEREREREREQGAGTVERTGATEQPIDAVGVAPPAGPDRWRYEQGQAWALGLKPAGAKIGPNNWTVWKALVDKHGVPVVIKALSGIDPRKRWPDETEKAITSARGQAGSMAETVNHKIKVITQ